MFKNNEEGFYCPHCGHSFHKDEVIEEEGELRCPFCNKLLETFIAKEEEE